jgi:hypothetical protein
MLWFHLFVRLNENELGYWNNYDKTKLKGFIQKGYMEYKCDSFHNILCNLVIVLCIILSEMNT